ncbi:rhodanese-related sulfurtransferase [Sphingomonas sp. AR_OL41]|uniref:oxygen-dependent tRNA uridine(34) hydroxylase TrhO n=1 Tax=Sphingomonas sp. AR_OL41 TaxID=3042729 RepID=UPI0024815B78|nr:rhodanese-related sulfurtransferase [Sphingomonas sp. AR_OL41]MDH7971647.1 rhodanese-related sulfurtransferase [Sphingomonas sp. AR_OL41]
MIRVAALYRFARFDDPAALRDRLADLCTDMEIRGTLLVAHEGINGTIAGAPDAIDHVVAELRALPGCADLDVKWSQAPTMPFLRMKVRVKREIVTMGVPDLDPLQGTGDYVAPGDWNALIAQPGTLLIDTRNDYEVRVGTFAGALDPATSSFRDFPAWVEQHRAEIAAADRVAMFCTGGIRCEKSTALLKSKGVSEVFHLKGGILAYLEQVPASDSRWEGECFVFDERVAIGHGLTQGSHSLCRACRMPVSPEDRASPLYVEGISCPACHAERDDVRRAGYAERHRQVKLAEARGTAHVGARPPVTTDR